jgi:sulfate/thiosulfate transport system permease protein
MSGRHALRAGALGYLGVVLVAPVALVFWNALAHGWQPFWQAVSNPAAVHALKLTLELALVAVPLNAIFGVACAFAIVRHRLPGMGFVNALVDLPLALSPVVVGLAPAFLTFLRVTLLSIRWAVAYGVVLTTARALGEFGAVSVVSGNVLGKTQTLTLYVQNAYDNFDTTGAYAASVVLAALAILTLALLTLLRPKEGVRGDRGA